MKNYSLPFREILLLAFPFIILLAPGQTSGQMDPKLSPGTASGTGTFLEVTDSDYLDIKLSSTHVVTARIESQPNTITIITEASPSDFLTKITLSGLAPNVTYYKYLDGYSDKETLVSNQTGVITYNLDLTRPHVVFIQEFPSTKVIRDNSTGGDCASIGTWYSETKTCVLQQSLSETIEIDSDGITLDGNGFGLSRSSRSGNGVYIFENNDITIRDVNVTNFTTGIRADYSSDITVEEGTYFQNGYALSTYETDDITFQNNRVISYTTANYLIQATNIINAHNVHLLGNEIDMITNPYRDNRHGIEVNNVDHAVITDNLISGTTLGMYLFSSQSGTVSGNTFTNTVGDGLLLIDSVDWDIYRNIFVGTRRFARDLNGINNRFNLDFPFSGNYWSDFDTLAEGCFDSNADFVCDDSRVFADNQDNAAWTYQNAWDDIPEIPTTYYARITGGTDRGTTIYSEPVSNSNAIKTLPNDWVVLVHASTNTGDWIQITDPTDDSQGWLPGGIESVPYQADKQTEYESVSVVRLQAEAERITIIEQAVEHYFANTDMEPSLYSGGDTVDFSLFNKIGFPKELVYAIAAQESGIVDFDNEIVTYDYGHGIMQITFKAHANEPNNFIKNNWDNRGKFSAYTLPQCKNILEGFDTGANAKKGTDDYKNCYKNTQTKNNFKKPYDPYQHDPSNQKYKQYTNSIQSIYSNIKDGLGILSKDKYLSKCPKEDLILDDANSFSCKEVEKLFMVWGFNGRVSDPEKNYMREVAHKLETLGKYFPGKTYTNNDHLIEKLRLANDNRVTLKAYSPVEVSITDTHGNTTGMIGGNQVSEIYNAAYFDQDEAVVMFFPDGDLTYNVRGTDNDTYGLVIESVIDGQDITFTATDLPTNPAAIHTYHLDHEALAAGELGATVDIDNDGDGIVEQTLQVGETLTDITPPAIYIGDIQTEYIVGESIIPSTLDITATDDTDENVNIRLWSDNQDITDLDQLVLQPGQTSIRIIATDDTGNTSEQIINLYSRYVFSGFKSPLANTDRINPKRTLPIKFSFADVFGNHLDSVAGKLQITDDTDTIIYTENFYPIKHGNYHINAKLEGVDSEYIVVKVLSDDRSVFEKILILLNKN